MDDQGTTGTASPCFVAIEPTPDQGAKRQAIAPWTGDFPQAAEVQKRYDGELDRTKVAHAGTTTLEARGDHVRTDGPQVWIEFSCQGGIVVRDQIHYHTIWRDRVTDHGAEFSL